MRLSARLLSLDGVVEMFQTCVETAGPEMTKRLAADLAPELVDGDLLILTGDLGAGKTCFVQGLGSGLGIDERITSPTFTLVSIHHGRLRLNHLDVYRLDGPRDSLDLDIPELLEDGVTVVEWGERIASVLPDDRLTVELRYPDLGPPHDHSPTGKSTDQPIDDPGDDHRRLRFEFAGQGWLDRRETVERLLEPWRVSC